MTQQMHDEHHEMLPKTLADAKLLLTGPTNPYVRDIAFFLDIPQHSETQLINGLKEHMDVLYQQKNTIPLLNKSLTQIYADEEYVQQDNTLLGKYQYTSENVDLMNTVHIGISIYNMYVNIEEKVKMKKIPVEYWEDDVKDLIFSESNLTKMSLFFIHDISNEDIIDCLRYVAVNNKNTEFYIMKSAAGDLVDYNNKEKMNTRNKNLSIVVILDEQNNPIELHYITTSYSHHIYYEEDIISPFQQAQRLKQRDNVQECLKKFVNNVNIEDNNIIRVFKPNEHHIPKSIVMFNDLLTILETKGEVSLFPDLPSAIIENDRNGMKLYERIRNLITLNKTSFLINWSLEISMRITKYKKFRKYGEQYCVLAEMNNKWRLIGPSTLDPLQRLVILGTTLEDDREWVHKIAEQAVADNFVTKDEFTSAQLQNQSFEDLNFTKTDTLSRLKTLFDLNQSSATAISTSANTTAAASSSRTLSLEQEKRKEKLLAKQNKHSQFIQKYQDMKKENERLKQQAEKAAEDARKAVEEAYHLRVANETIKEDFENACQLLDIDMEQL